MEYNKVTKSQAFHKIIKCLKSCKNEIHLEACNKMILQYEKLFRADEEVYTDIDTLRSMFYYRELDFPVAI
jgi:hypothetical protein